MSKYNTPDNPLVSLLSGFGELIIVNALLILCSLPVITMGASLTAAHKTVRDMTMGQCSGIAKCFFGAFRSNFKQSTIAWNGFLLPLACAALSYLSLQGSESPLATSWIVGTLVILILGLGVLSYLFPMLSRYDNSLLQHLKNASILAILHFPRTIFLITFSILPLVILLWFTPWFFYLLPFWILCGFAVLIWLNSLLLNSVFRKLENQNV